MRAISAAIGIMLALVGAVACASDASAHAPVWRTADGARIGAPDWHATVRAYGYVTVPRWVCNGTAPSDLGAHRP